jgi:hypothetical protein
MPRVIQAVIAMIRSTIPSPSCSRCLAMFSPLAMSVMTSSGHTCMEPRQRLFHRGCRFGFVAQATLDRPRNHRPIAFVVTVRLREQRKMQHVVGFFDHGCGSLSVDHRRAFLFLVS